MSKISAALSGALLLLVAAVAEAAPAQGAPGAQKAAEHQAERTRPEQAKVREEKRDQVSEVGERQRATGERAEQAREHARDMAEGQGEQTAEEMQARREERKEIQEQYREAHQASEVPQAKKKPWWKFWESDDDG